MTVFRDFKDGVLVDVRVHKHSSDKPEDPVEFHDTYTGDPNKLPFEINKAITDALSKT